MLSPEIIAEQVMGYAIGASELIPTLTPPKQAYSVAILPQGPHYYTGLLQAAGYLLLDSKKKKILIISQQTDDPKNILVDTTIYGPIFGQTRETPMQILSKTKTSIGAKYSTKEHKKLMETLHFQIPFMRVITDIEEILHIGVGDTISQNQNNKLFTWIKKNIQEYNIILLTNIEISPSSKSQKSDEQKKIAKIIETSPNTLLLTIFQKILKLHNKKPEIIAYVNPGDFGKTGSLTTRYICAVG